MKKKNIVLFVVCILLLVAIIGVVFLGQKNISITPSSSNKTVSPVIEEIATDKSEVEKDKSDTNRFDGLTITNKDIGIPVLCYHSIENSTNNELLLAPEKFRTQLKYLKDNGYTPLTMDELYGFLKEKKSIPEKSVVITFDDGYRDNYTNAFPILKEFNFKATIYVISDYINDGLYMTKEQIKEMSDWGIDIQSHTAKHEDLSKLKLDQQYDTMKSSKETLEKIIGKNVDYIAYPFGKHNNDTKKAAEKAGYKLGFSLEGGLTDRGDNPYNLDRIYISNNHTMEEFVYKLTKTPK